MRVRARTHTQSYVMHLSQTIHLSHLHGATQQATEGYEVNQLS